MNFSLNYVADNKLIMRTLLETSTTAVWLNEYGVKLVLQAAAKTRHDQPFILLKDPSDMHSSSGRGLERAFGAVPEAFLASVIGAPVKRATFLYAVTFENYADMHSAQVPHLVGRGAEFDGLVRTRCARARRCRGNAP